MQQVTSRRRLARKALTFLKKGLRSEESYLPTSSPGPYLYLKDVCFKAIHYNLMSERPITLSYSRTPGEIRDLERLCSERFGLKELPSVASCGNPKDFVIRCKVAAGLD